MIPASSAAGSTTVSAVSRSTALAAPPRNTSPAYLTIGSVTAVAMPASTSAGASSVRGSRRSASHPPNHAPYAIAASAMPITELVTWRVTPTYGPTRRNETVSSTSTAPLEKKTRNAASPLGRARGGTGASAAGSAMTSDDVLLTVAMVRSAAGGPRQYIEM